MSNEGITPVAPTPPGGFELVAPLGCGATSVVWAATCLALGDVVALKWAASAEAVAGARLEEEAARLATIDDPNVVRLFDVVAAADRRPVLVLELAAGGALSDRLGRRGRLSPGEVAQLGAGVAGGLAALHRAGFAHRDVKPSNILLGDDDRPLLADLGAAAPLDGWSPGAAVTGTMAYLDPAVVDGGPPGPAADVYALGVTLLEALTGAPPAGRPPAPPTLAGGDPVADRLSAALARALLPAPADRWGAADLAAELGAIAALAAEPVAAPAHVPVPLARTGALPPLDDGTTRTFGPRPPVPPPPDAPAPRGVAALGLVAAVTTAVALLSPLSPLSREAAARPALACPPVGAGAGAVAADLDGDGCLEALRWDGTVLQVPAVGGDAARYALGRPGDTLLFGDWDCDGRDAPALHRPATGEVIRFDRLPDPGAPLAGTSTSGAPGAGARVGTGPDGCDRVLLDRGRDG